MRSLQACNEPAACSSHAQPNPAKPPSLQPNPDSWVLPAHPPTQFTPIANMALAYDPNWTLNEKLLYRVKSLFFDNTDMQPSDAEYAMLNVMEEYQYSVLKFELGDESTFVEVIYKAAQHEHTPPYKAAIADARFKMSYYKRCDMQDCERVHAPWGVLQGVLLGIKPIAMLRELRQLMPAWEGGAYSKFAWTDGGDGSDTAWSTFERGLTCPDYVELWPNSEPYDCDFDKILPDDDDVWPSEPPPLGEEW